jgi:hypothetical protein
MCSLFSALANKVEDLITTECPLRGPIYISSYCEGVVDAIKENIILYGIEIPENKKPTKPLDTQALTTKSEELTKPKTDKPKPADKSVYVGSQSLVQDIAAYFRGIDDGKHLFLEDILEIAEHNQQAQQLAAQDKDETKN